MDCYALRNIFHDRVAKGDLVVKAGKKADPRIRRPELAMNFFMGREDPMEEEAKNMASSSSTPLPLVDEEMVTRILQEDKIQAFLEGIRLRPMARREVAQALTGVMERNHEVAAVEGSLMQVAYQEAKDSVTFSSKDLANQVVDGDRPLYPTDFLGASRIKRELVDTDTSTNILPLPTFDALGILKERIILEPLQAVWRNKQVVIEATGMPFDRTELHFVEAALYQEYELEGKNKILPFNPIALQVEEEDDGEVVEPKRPSKIRRTTKPDGGVVYRFQQLKEGDEEHGKPNSLNLIQ
nr:hypothetical protein CFP56_77439 [Quercus suber]